MKSKVAISTEIIPADESISLRKVTDVHGGVVVVQGACV